jgi:tetratricopeptide (TPR) repeat protein
MFRPHTLPGQISLMLIVLWLGCSSLLGDVLILKDGTRLEGQVKRNASGWTVTTSDGKTVEVSADRVKSIEVGSSPQKGSPEQAMSNLQSLRRSVENVPEIRQVLERYRRFIEQNKDTPAAAEALKDVAVWEDRQMRGLVKLGGKWVTAQERTGMASQALAVAEQARALVQAGRMTDGDQLLQQALDADPQCAPALYLRGVVQHAQNQLPASRKTFEAVAALISDHGPTLNNLAAILWRQNAIMPALNHYDQAMVAAPVNKDILDNVAEALASVPEEQRKNVIAQRTFRRFAEQDKRLQELMAAQGWYRWGATWIDRAAMERLKEIETEVNAKIAAANTEVENAQRKVNTLEGEIASIERTLKQIEAQSLYRDSEGRLVRVPYPPVYYELQNDHRKLSGDRSATLAKLTRLREDENKLRAQLPQPKFTGAHRVIGAEGTPMMVMPDETEASTQPATSQPE